jgi:hypothetical protein
MGGDFVSLHPGRRCFSTKSENDIWAVGNSLFDPIPGFSGLGLGAVVFLIVRTVSFLVKKVDSYNLDPMGKAEALEPFLAKYLRAAEFIIGLATGSIVVSWIISIAWTQRPFCRRSTPLHCCF